MSEFQKDLLREAFEKVHAQGGEIVIATDKDAAGQQIAQELKKIAPTTASISRVVPKHHKDWNEAVVAQILRNKQQSKSQERGFSL